MKPIKLHLGCGTVYLKNYINVDVYQEGYSFLASDHPDLRVQNETALKQYYRYPFGQGPHICVADVFMDLRNLTFPANYADEILNVNTFEHFGKAEAVELLKQWRRILKPGGTLHIDVPDMVETARLLVRAQTIEEVEWAIRLIYGSQKNAFSFHKWGYTFESLKHVCEGVGYANCRRTDLIDHCYPNFTLSCEKHQ